MTDLIERDASKSFGPVPFDAIQEAMNAPIGETVKIIRKFAPYFAFTREDYRAKIEKLEGEDEDTREAIESAEELIDDLESALRENLPSLAAEILRRELKEANYSIENYKDELKKNANDIKKFKAEIKALKGQSND